VAVMGGRRGRGCEAESRRERFKASFHAALQRSEPTLPVYYEQAGGKSPRAQPGALVVQRVAYLLTWRLAPPLAPRPWAPGMSPLETSLTHSEFGPL
jgi:hypothetical protein